LAGVLPQNSLGKPTTLPQSLYQNFGVLLKPEKRKQKVKRKGKELNRKVRMKEMREKAKKEKKGEKGRKKEGKGRKGKGTLWIYFPRKKISIAMPMQKMRAIIHKKVSASWAQRPPDPFLHTKNEIV